MQTLKFQKGHEGSASSTTPAAAEEQNWMDRPLDLEVDEIAKQRAAAEEKERMRQQSADEAFRKAMASGVAVTLNHPAQARLRKPRAGDDVADAESSPDVLRAAAFPPSGDHREAQRRKFNVKQHIREITDLYEAELRRIAEENEVFNMCLLLAFMPASYFHLKRPLFSFCSM